MPERQTASRFGIRIVVITLAISAVGLGGMAIVLFRFPIVDEWTIGGTVIFLIACLTLAVSSIYSGRFNCPRCGCHIPNAIRFVGPLEYYCQNCDVIWDTGVKRWTGGD